MVKKFKHTPIDIVKKQSPIISTDLADRVERIFDNMHTQEDILEVGVAIGEFKKSEIYQVLVKTVRYTIDSLLDENGTLKSEINSDKALGIQLGARRILSTLSGLDRSAQILDKQIEFKRNVEKESNEENLDPEDLTPRKSKGNNMGI